MLGDELAVVPDAEQGLDLVAVTGGDRGGEGWELPLACCALPLNGGQGEPEEMQDTILPSLLYPPFLLHLLYVLNADGTAAA